MKDKLQELGFSEKEAIVYLVLLAIGSAVASDIAKRAKIKRPTAYVILEFLTQRGLVSAMDRRGVRLYHAAPAEQLVQHMQNMAERYEGFADTAKKLVPALKASRSAASPLPGPTKVHFFEGNRGLKAVYEDTLASLEDIRVHAAFEHEYEQGEAASSTRKAPDIKMRITIPEAAGDKKRSASDKDALRKALIASRGADTFASEINVYDDRVTFISAAEDFALTVESRELAEALRKTFAASDEKAAEEGTATFRPAFTS